MLTGGPSNIFAESHVARAAAFNCFAVATYYQGPLRDNAVEFFLKKNYVV